MIIYFQTTGCLFSNEQLRTTLILYFQMISYYCDCHLFQTTSYYFDMMWWSFIFKWP